MLKFNSIVGYKSIMDLLKNLVRCEVYKYCADKNQYYTNIFDYCVYFSINTHENSRGLIWYSINQNEPITYTDLKDDMDVKSIIISHLDDETEGSKSEKYCNYRNKLVHNIIENKELTPVSLGTLKMIDRDDYTDKEFLLYVLKVTIEGGLNLKGLMRTHYCSELEFKIDPDSVSSVYEMIQKEYDDNLFHKETQVTLTNSIKDIYVENYGSSVLLIYSF